MGDIWIVQVLDAETCSQAVPVPMVFATWECLRDTIRRACGFDKGYDSGIPNIPEELELELGAGYREYRGMMCWTRGDPPGVGRDLVRFCCYRDVLRGHDS